MKFTPIGPGRVSAPILEVGDAVALAHRHGEPVGPWYPITDGLWVVAMVVPERVGPVTSWVARDRHGWVQWWSPITWYPALYPGSVAKLPLQVEARADRAPSPVRGHLPPHQPPLPSHPDAPTPVPAPGARPRTHPRPGPR